MCGIIKSHIITQNLAAKYVTFVITRQTARNFLVWSYLMLVADIKIWTCLFIPWKPDTKSIFHFRPQFQTIQNHKILEGLSAKYKRMTILTDLLTSVLKILIVDIYESAPFSVFRDKLDVLAPRSKLCNKPEILIQLCRKREWQLGVIWRFKIMLEYLWICDLNVIVICIPPLYYFNL